MMRMFGLGCAFIFAAASARLLGPREYGVVAVALSTATVAATLASLGINDLAVRETATFWTRSASAELRSFVAWAVKSVARSSIICLLLMAAASLVPGPYRQAYLVGSLAVPILAEILVLRGVIQGMNRVILAQLPLEIVRWIVLLGLILMLILGRIPASASIVIAMMIIGLAVALVVAIATLRSILSLASATPSKGPQRKWLPQALPFLAISLFGIIGTEISTLLLGLLSGPREAGLYQPIARLAPVMILANGAIEAALAPRIVHLREQGDQQSLQRLVSRSALASAIATAGLSAAILVASPWILGAFGPEFQEYRYLLAWIAATQVINAAAGSAPLVLAMTGDMRTRISAQAATLAVQAGVGLLLVPKLGASGAVISLISAILTWALLHWWLAYRAIGIDTSILGLMRKARRSS